MIKKLKRAFHSNRNESTPNSINNSSTPQHIAPLTSAKSASSSRRASSSSCSISAPSPTPKKSIRKRTPSFHNFTHTPRPQLPSESNTQVTDSLLESISCMLFTTNPSSRATASHPILTTLRQLPLFKPHHRDEIALTYTAALYAVLNKNSSIDTINLLSLSEFLKLLLSGTPASGNTISPNSCLKIINFFVPFIQAQQNDNLLFLSLRKIHFPNFSINPFSLHPSNFPIEYDQLQDLLAPKKSFQDPWSITEI